MTPFEVVERFTDLAERCLREIQSAYGGIGRSSVAGPAGLLPNSGGAPVRSGLLGSIGSFQVHGQGCQFELIGGEVLDIDWNVEGQAIFDSWRISTFAKSVGEVSVDKKSLRLAAIQSPRLLQLGDDWFTWADRNYDLPWRIGSAT